MFGDLLLLVRSVTVLRQSLLLLGNALLLLLLGQAMLGFPLLLLRLPLLLCLLLSGLLLRRLLPWRILTVCRTRRARPNQQRHADNKRRFELFDDKDFQGMTSFLTPYVLPDGGCLPLAFTDLSDLLRGSVGMMG